MASEFNSLKGKLLLDGGKLQGSFFHRSVVLICEHNADGAMGLVLNRQTENDVSEVILEELPDSVQNQTLFLGGPVQPDALSYLHSDRYLADSNVFDNLRVGHALEELIEVGESFSPTKRLRVFAGYAGWEEGQLDSEMEQGAWLTHTGDLDLIFNVDPEQLWKRILVAKGGLFRLISEAPEDLSRN
jgi:putative transcriptional regulator